MQCDQCKNYKSIINFNCELCHNNYCDHYYKYCNDCTRSFCVFCYDKTEIMKKVCEECGDNKCDHSSLQNDDDILMCSKCYGGFYCKTYGDICRRCFKKTGKVNNCKKCDLKVCNKCLTYCQGDDFMLPADCLRKCPLDIYDAYCIDCIYHCNNCQSYCCEYCKVDHINYFCGEN